MNIHFPGLVKKFDDVKSGEAFFCASREGCHFAVKSQELNCAVTVGYPNRASPPRFYDLDAFLGNFADRVLTIADLKIVPSTSMEDVQTGNETNPGTLYIFDDNALHLAIVTGNYEGTMTDHLLNLQTGEIKKRNFYRTIPMAVSKWAVIIEAWGKPRTLFSYPPPGA